MFNKKGGFVKVILAAVTILASLSTMASTCESLLLEKIQHDPNLKVVKQLNSYNCGANACENDFSPSPNIEVLAFLDTQNQIQVNWVPVQNKFGWETVKKNVKSYVELVSVQQDAITLKASRETPRDSLFWPPHRVFFQETLNCR
jgi:hypothetical protein